MHILSMILQAISINFYNLSTRLACASYAGIIHIMVMIVNHSSRLSISRNQVTIKTIMCQPIDQNIDSSGFDQIQPPQYPAIHHPSQEMSEEVLQAKENLIESIQTFLQKFSRYPFGVMPKVLSIAWERFSEIKHASTDKQYQPAEIQELMCKLLEDVRNINKELSEYINSLSWNYPTFYNDDDELSIQHKEYLENSSNAITTVLPTKEPEYSLSMEYEHLSTIPEMKSDKVIESSAKNLVPIPSEYEVTSDDESECDVPVNDVSSLIFTNFSNPLFDYNDDFTSSDDESLSSEEDEFSGELAHINPILPGIKEADFDLEEEIHLVEICCDIHFLKELLSDDSIPLPKNESFNFDHHDDPSFSRPPPKPPDVEFFFDFEPNSEELIAAVINNIDELNEDECFDPGGEIDVFSNVEDDDYSPFIFVIRIFLPYLIYPEVSPLLLSTGSKDTIFDPDISI
nr:hypothetical protein [Tanacetum cinerariifolium]